MKQNIRSNYVKDSLLDYEKLTQSLKENTTNAVKDLLSEAVRDTYNKIMAESFDDDYEEEEVEDTDSVSTSTEPDDTSSEETETTETSTEETTDDTTTDGEGEESTTEVTPDGSVEKTTTGSDGEGNEWSEFEKYKVADDKYNLTNAQDDEIVKIYKLMKDDDQLIVTKDGENLHLQDNETGADYIIDLSTVPEEGEDAEATTETDSLETQDDSIDVVSDDEPSEFEDDENMNEERIFEVVLNEYNSNVGYTDNYQKKDVMTNNGMSEPAKSSSTNDWDAGVPNGTEKPWSGKKDKTNAPFDGEKGKTIEEEADDLEEANLSQSRWNDTHAAHNRVPAANDDAFRRKGIQKTSKGAKYRATGSEDVNEALVKKANAIFEENKKLKAALKDFRNTLMEAAVTNVNLGKIIKLLSENTTSMEEKKEIISRFGKEAKTIEQANSLYESISNELKKKAKMNINEDKQFVAQSSQMINETQIYKSKDLMESLGMMHRLCKL